MKKRGSIFEFQQGAHRTADYLGSAPLQVSEFRAAVLGQLGEPRIEPAIEADMTSDHSHAKALDVDTRGPLRDIHRRVGTAILFESSGGMAQDLRLAHLPELRFALGEPLLDTTTIDSAATTLESKAFFLRKVGTDGYRFGFQPTLKKVVSDRKASRDEEDDIRKPMLKLVREDFKRGATLPVVDFPADGTAVGDSPRLTLVVLDPDTDWNHKNTLERNLSDWTKRRGEADRLYPGALVWCVKKPGRALREKVELCQAWKKVEQEVKSGVLGGEFEAADRDRVNANARDAAEDEGHADWIWRIADHRGLKKCDFERLELTNFLPADAQVKVCPVRIAENYVIFSAEPTETLILEHPPLVARNVWSGKKEVWEQDDFSQAVRDATLGVAHQYGVTRSRSLRSRNVQRPHPPVHWEVPHSEGLRWRRTFLRLLHRRLSKQV